MFPTFEVEKLEKKNKFRKYFWGVSIWGGRNLPGTGILRGAVLRYTEGNTVLPLTEKKTKAKKRTALLQPTFEVGKFETNWEIFIGAAAWGMV